MDRFHLRVEAERHPALLESCADVGRDVAVFARDQLGITLQHGHLRTEFGVHRRELQPDVTAAHDHQPFRQLFQLHDRRAGIDPVAFAHPCNGRDNRLRTGIDEDAVRFQAQLFAFGVSARSGSGRDFCRCRAARSVCTAGSPRIRSGVPAVRIVGRKRHIHLVRPGERAGAGIDGNIRFVCEVAVVFVPQQRRDLLFSPDRAAVVFAPLSESRFRTVGGQLGLVHEGFGRNAPHVDAGSPVHLVGLFDNGYLPAACPEVGCERFAALAETDDDCVVGFHSVSRFDGFTCVISFPVGRSAYLYVSRGSVVLGFDLLDEVHIQYRAFPDIILFRIAGSSHGVRVSCRALFPG